MTVCIAFLRGINVGKAKRIAMADLRELVEGLGFTNVRTLLNSGNVVFEASRPNSRKIASSIETAIEAKCGFGASVIVITESELVSVIEANPLPQATEDPAKFLVAFAGSAVAVDKAKALCDENWEPDALGIGDKVVYLWCASGILESKLAKSFARVTGDTVTTRNWATVLKLQSLVTTR